MLNKACNYGAYRPSWRISGFIAIITIMLTVFQTNSLWAASPTLSDKEELNRRAKQEAQDRQLREQGKDVFLQQEQPAGETPAPFRRQGLLSVEAADCIAVTDAKIFGTEQQVPGVSYDRRIDKQRLDTGASILPSREVVYQ